MDGDWAEITRAPFPPPVIGLPQTPATTMTFDTSQELLWTGNDYGRVSSFYGTELQRYTSFMAHAIADGPVQQILTNDKGVVALGRNDLHMALRRGPPIWHLRHEKLKDMQCMSFTSKMASEVLIAGNNRTMLVVDLNRGEVVKQIPTEHHYTIMRQGRHIYAATINGTVHLLDPDTFAVIREWNAHTGLISDMDCRNDFIVTCGYSIRQGQNYGLDNFVNIFDVKKMSSVAPLPFPPGAAYIRMHPRLLTTSFVVSQHGQIHVADLLNSNTSHPRQLNISSYLTMFDVSPSGEALALMSGECQIHIWGSPVKSHFVDAPNQVEYATQEDPTQPMDWSPDTPLNKIGMPLYRDVLASAWPNMVHDVGAPPVKFDQQFISTLSPADFGAYGPNKRDRRRNQVEYTRDTARNDRSAIMAPKFLSEKAREAAQSSLSSLDDKADALADQIIDGKKTEVPAKYRNVEIKYSKFGVDDFDFGFYNKTRYSGLEIHISNSYANSLLQLLNFTPIIRNTALQHAATACASPDCLLCELGFLFDMLQKADGSICQATNLLKTLSNHKKAANMGILEEEAAGSPLNIMLQNLTRFVLGTIVKDYNAISPDTSVMEQILTTAATSSIQCMSCRSEYNRVGSIHVNDLMYPSIKTPGRNAKMPRITFSQVLKNSIERETTSKGWCSKCQRYQTIATRKTVHGIPAVLMLNTAITNQEHKMLWATPDWLPEEIGIIVDHGQLFCYEGNDLKLHLQRGMHNIAVYSLVGMAVNIDGGQTNKSHLVSMINTAHSEPVAPGQDQWYLFNDFLVCPVGSDEARNFNTAWKQPSVLCYQVKHANNKIDTTWRDNIDTSLLYQDLSPSSNPSDKTYQVLSRELEPPGPDTIIALDTEFVAIRLPEIEMNSDGERETIRPIVYSLARVSVVRGQGVDEGVPFIDDYIAIRENIVDYLTSYSGITPDDLNPEVTNHCIVPLKQSYKKLWILLNLGCKFLGHGLKQDFRVINIHVPKRQVIDTIELFFLKSRLRKLSLAFLAWHLLREDIQMETHDSIEDSRTALKLYRKYLEFQDAGILETILHDIYRTGKEVNFKPPRKDDQPVQRTDTPPLPVDSNNGLPTTPSQTMATTAAPTPGSGFTSSWTPGKGSPLR